MSGNKPMSYPVSRSAIRKPMTRAQVDALRNISATREARKSDPSIYHVQAMAPDLLLIPTPEEMELLEELAEQGLKEIQQMKVERNRRDRE